MVKEKEATSKKKIIIRSTKGINHAKTLKLRAEGRTVTEIAAIQGCDKSNITRVLQRYGSRADEVEDYKAHRADILASLQMRLISAITDEEIKKASLQTKGMVYGILFDKERLERGQATQITDQFRVAIQRIEAKMVSDKPKIVSSSDHIEIMSTNDDVSH